MAESQLAVFAGLLENGSAEFGTELLARTEPAIYPDFDIISARSHRFVNFRACLLGRRYFRVGCEAVLYSRDSRAEQLAALLRFAHLHDFVRISLHAGRRGHAVKRVLAQLGRGFGPDVAVRVDDA